MNSNNSALFSFFNDKKNSFLFIGTLLCATPIAAMDLTSSRIGLEPSFFAVPAKNSPDYKEQLTSLMFLVNLKVDDINAKKVQIAHQLSSLKECAQTKTQKENLEYFEKVWRTEKNEATLQRKFDQLYNKVQAIDFTTSCERFHNQLNQSNKEDVLQTFQEIRSLIPITSTHREQRAEQIEALLSQNVLVLSKRVIEQCHTLMYEIETLSFDPDKPEVLLQQSVLPTNMQQASAQGSSTEITQNFSLTFNTQEIIDYILTQQFSDNQQTNDSFKIYLLQLLWSCTMQRKDNTIVQKNQKSARTIANALRSMTYKKDSSGIAQYTETTSPGTLYAPRSNSKYRGKLGKHIDIAYTGNDLYSIAILPSIKYNAGEVATFIFHGDPKDDTEQNPNALFLADLIKNNNSIDPQFKNFLQILIQERDTVIPAYDTTQPHRKLDNSDEEFKKAKSPIMQHYPLTKETLDRTDLPDKFKGHLENYLNLSNQTEKEKKPITTEIITTNNTANATMEPQHPTHTPDLSLNALWATHTNTPVLPAIVGEQHEAQDFIADTDLENSIKKIELELVEITKAKQNLAQQEIRINNFNKEIKQPIQKIINGQTDLDNIITTLQATQLEANELKNETKKISQAIEQNRSDIIQISSNKKQTTLPTNLGVSNRYHISQEDIEEHISTLNKSPKLRDNWNTIPALPRQKNKDSNIQTEDSNIQTYDAQILELLKILLNANNHTELFKTKELQDNNDGNRKHLIVERYANTLQNVILLFEAQETPEQLKKIINDLLSDQKHLTLLNELYKKTHTEELLPQLQEALEYFGENIDQYNADYTPPTQETYKAQISVEKMLQTRLNLKIPNYFDVKEIKMWRNHIALLFKSPLCAQDKERVEGLLTQIISKKIEQYKANDLAPSVKTEDNKGKEKDRTDKQKKVTLLKQKCSEFKALQTALPKYKLVEDFKKAVQKPSGFLNALWNNRQCKKAIAKAQNIINLNLLPEEENQKISERINEYTQTTWSSLLFASVSWFFGLFKFW